MLLLLLFPLALERIQSIILLIDDLLLFGGTHRKTNRPGTVKKKPWVNTLYV